MNGDPCKISVDSQLEKSHSTLSGNSFPRENSVFYSPSTLLWHSGNSLSATATIRIDAKSMRQHYFVGDVKKMNPNPSPLASRRLRRLLVALAITITLDETPGRDEEEREFER
uniref:Uncharacterized protein n=1 Tax=Nelumbo nucifera TaxID=4432 RepID=A0A822YFU4_NELNU|nr:TPA_asm: hypothetical protein HUJ06_031324 [Nelumbo nucifera]